MSDGLYIGLISGTSMDAVDCALLRCQGDTIEPRDFFCQPIPAKLRERILALCRKDNVSLTALGELDVELGRLFADVALELMTRHALKPQDITAIGSHGQTIWHQPAAHAEDSRIPFTLQIADPNSICQRTQVTTVADFRRKDMAAGGQAAPLVPAFHHHFFRSSEVDRVVVNIGGMSNVTVLSRDTNVPIKGFDTGPGNVLMDSWIHAVKGESYDAHGAWAATGTINNDLLNFMLDEPYFQLPPPKSTGRELFNSDWLKAKLDVFTRTTGQTPAPEDVQATLLQLTAYTVGSVVRQVLPTGELVICGGGANNGTLMQALREQLPGFKVASSEDFGLHPDAVEANAFAWMASRTLARERIDFTSITGASAPVIAGGIYYY